MQQRERQERQERQEREGSGGKSRRQESRGAPSWLAGRQALAAIPSTPARTRARGGARKWACGLGAARESAPSARPRAPGFVRTASFAQLRAQAHLMPLERVLRRDDEREPEHHPGHEPGARAARAGGVRG
jgi:hypothetical protein